MDNVLQVLDREIGYLKSQNATLDAALTTAIKERDDARTQTKLTAARAEAAEKECAALREQLAAIPATMSRAEWDARIDKLHELTPAGTLEEVNHELS
jgi:predicted  nucleic acid-binding Zn-ribbon protein